MNLLALLSSRRRISLLAFIWIGCTACLPPLQTSLLASAIRTKTVAYESILRDIDTGRANDAISKLREQLSADPEDARAHHLLCRVYMQEERWADAEQECERSVQLEPNNSDYHLWLGRAYGGDAAHTSIRRAYMLAKKVRAEFDTAIELDPHNVQALSDLGRFDVEVPRLIGGGLNRAEKIAEQLKPLDISRWHELRARIAEKQSEFVTAEREWKEAIRTSDHPAHQWMNLAAMFAKQKNFAAMQQAIDNGIASSPSPGSALVEGASLFIDNHQNLHQAQEMLQRYLASPNKSEDAPAFQVYVQLGTLLESRGDKAGARREFTAASALASQYAPAKQTNHG